VKPLRATGYCVKVPPAAGSGFFLRLETDDCRVGWGEVAILGGLFGLERAFGRLIEGVSDRFLRGRDPLLGPVPASLERGTPVAPGVPTADPDLVQRTITVTLTAVAPTPRP
jgi:hypothetical protein